MVPGRARISIVTGGAIATARAKAGGELGRAARVDACQPRGLALDGAALLSKAGEHRIDLGLRLTWSDAGWGALGGVASLVLAAIAAAITTIFVPDLTSSAADAANELLEGSSRLSVVVFALMVMVGAPIVEEIFFRGLLFASLRKRGLGAVLTIVISALVFAGFHFEPLRFFVLLPTGLVLGWVRWKTGSTGAAIVTHGLLNAPGAVLLLLGGQGMSP